MVWSMREFISRYFDRFSRLREIAEIANWAITIALGSGAIAMITGIVEGLSLTVTFLAVLAAVSLTLVIISQGTNIIRDRSLYGKIRLNDLSPRRLLRVMETGEPGIEVGARLENRSSRVMHMKMESGRFHLQRRIGIDDGKVPDKVVEILPFSSMEIQMPTITDINLDELVSGSLTLKVLYGYKPDRLIYRYSVDVRLDILVRPVGDGQYAMEPDAKVLEATYTRV